MTSSSLGMIDPSSLAQHQHELAEDGVTVLPGVLTPDQCDSYITQLHSWLAKFGTGFPDHTKTIIHKYSLGQSQVAWATRLALKPLFSQLWGTEKLLCSTDSIAIGEPPELGRTKFWQEGDFTDLHHDQGKKRVGKHCIQGAVYLEEQQEDDWCFVVLNGSHKYHTEFFDTHPPDRRSEHRKISSTELQWYQDKGCMVRRIACPKGGIILWDSRTVHAGAPSKEGRQNSGRWRYVVFVCMGPAAWATPEDLQVKREAYESVGITRHPPCNGVSMFRRNAPTPFDFTQLPDIAKTDEAKQLAGVIEYDFSDGKPNGPEMPQWR